LHIFTPVQRTLEAINFSHITLPHVELFLKFFQNRLSSKFVVMFKLPPCLNHGATLHCDVLLIIKHVSRWFCFSHFNISQGNVATRLRCGGTFYYRFAGN